MITSIHPNPVTIGTLDRGIDIPINKWWGIRFGEGEGGAWQGSYERLLDKGFESDIPELTPAEATTAYGIEGALKFDMPIQDRAAREKRARVLEEMRVDQWRQSAKHNALGWKGITGFGAMVAGQMSNPLDFGLSIMPIFGAEKVGAQAAAKAGWKNAWKLGEPLTAVGQKGGLLSFKASGVLAKVPMFTESVLNGAASSAVGELTTYFDQRSRGEDTNYLGNVMTGAVASGAFHFGVRLLAKGIDAAAFTLRSLTPETIEAGAARAATTVEQGGKITADADAPLAHAGADENVMRGADSGADIHKMNQAEYAEWLASGLGTQRGQRSIYRELVKKPEYRQEAKRPTKEESSEASYRLMDLENTTGFKGSDAGWTYRKFGDSESKNPDGTRSKVYVTLPDWRELTPERLKALSERLEELGYNGQVKVPGAVPFNSWRLIEAFDNIVGHVKDAAEAALFKQAVSEIFPSGKLTDGIDPVGTSMTDALATDVNNRAVDSRSGKTDAARETRVQSFLDSQDPKLKAQREAARNQQDLDDAAKQTAPTENGRKWATVDDMQKEKAQLDAESAELELSLRKELAEELGDTEAVTALDVEIKKLKEEMDMNTKINKAAADCLLKNGIPNG